MALFGSLNKSPPLVCGGAAHCIRMYLLYRYLLMYLMYLLPYLLLYLYCCTCFTYCTSTAVPTVAHRLNSASRNARWRRERPASTHPRHSSDAGSVGSNLDTAGVETSGTETATMVGSRGSTPATGAAEERRNGNSNGGFMTPLGVSPVGDEKQEKEGDVWGVGTMSVLETGEEEGEARTRQNYKTNKKKTNKKSRGA